MELPGASPKPVRGETQGGVALKKGEIISHHGENGEEDSISVVNMCDQWLKGPELKNDPDNKGI